MITKIKPVILSLPYNNLQVEIQHYLLQIDWNNKYLEFVPEDFKPFFLEVLSHLAFRTTDVHTARSLKELDLFLTGISTENDGASINRNVVGLALILHDVGWGKLSQADIAQSLVGKGVKVTEESLDAKTQHAVDGEILARELLDKSNNEMVLALSEEDKNLILKCVRYHDSPKMVAGDDLPLEVKAVVDLDHIWSFTYLNFWHDTQRKEKDPREYLNEARGDIDGYFATQFGRDRANELLDEREKEVEQFEAGMRFVSLPDNFRE